eukprot:3571270-Prymnesium_polylepis.1
MEPTAARGAMSLRARTRDGLESTSSAHSEIAKETRRETCTCMCAPHTTDLTCAHTLHPHHMTRAIMTHSTQGRTNQATA